MTPPHSWVVRPATVADADDIGRIHVRVWRADYADLVPAAVLARMDAGRSADHWRRTLAAPGADETVRVAVTDDAQDDPRLVGYALGGPPRDPDAPEPRELQVINLLPEARGTGVADELVRQVLGDRAAYLWVLQGNARAMAFYGRSGFVDDGGRTTHAASGLTEIRMVRPGPA